MKFLQLLFVGLFASNFVCGSQYEYGKEMFNGMVSAFVPVEETGRAKEAGSLYSPEIKTQLLEVAGQLKEDSMINQVVIDVMRAWSITETNQRFGGSLYLLQCNFCRELATVSDECGRDALIEQYAREYAECYENITNDRNEYPRCLVGKKW